MKAEAKYVFRAKVAFFTAETIAYMGCRDVMVDHQIQVMTQAKIAAPMLNITEDNQVEGENNVRIGQQEVAMLEQGISKKL